MKERILKSIVYILIIVIGIPVIAIMFVKPDKTNWKKIEKPKSSINTMFSVIIYDEKGNLIKEVYHNKQVHSR